MNLRFAPSALALALSATSVALSNNVDSNGAGALLADRFVGGAEDDGDGKSAATMRRAERMFPLDADGVAGDSSEFDAADAGILRSRRLNGNGLLFGGTGGLVARRRGQRSLQEDDGEVTCIKPDTCEPNLCKCTANGGLAYECAAELDALCNNVTAADGTVFTISGCVNYPAYYYNLYCPFAKCVVDGGTYEGCFCKFYNTSCAMYDSRKYKYDEDHIQHCEADSCCLGKMDDAGRASCFEGAPTISPAPTTLEPTTQEWKEEKPSRPATILPIPSPADASPASGAGTPFSWDIVSAATSFAAAAAIFLN